MLALTLKPGGEGLDHVILMVVIAVDQDAATVCRPAYPEPCVLDVAAEDVAAGSEPGDLGGNDCRQRIDEFLATGKGGRLPKCSGHVVLSMY